MFFFFVRFFTAMSLFSSLFVLSLLLQCHFLPMTLTNMNTLRFTPKKDYETNRMQSGKLQFSAGVSRLIFTHAFTHTHVHIPPPPPPTHPSTETGTLLVVDETQLSPGRLNEQGVKNLASLCHLCRWQRIHYDFQYYNTEFSCDTVSAECHNLSLIVHLCSSCD